MTLTGLTSLVDVVTRGDDRTLLSFWVTLAGLTTFVDDVTTGEDGTWGNWATPVGQVILAGGVTNPSGWTVY